MEANLASEGIAADTPRRRRLRSLLYRFKRRRGEGPAAPPVPADATFETAQPAEVDPGLQRARAALSNARMLMPGLLEVPARQGATSAEPIAALPLPPLPYADQLAPPGVARLEAAILQLEEERSQLRAEVMALRMAVEELRETLLQFDERQPLPRQIDVVDAEAPRQHEASLGPPVSAPAPAFSLEDAASHPTPDTRHPPGTGLVYPAGSVGLRLRLRPVSSPAALAALHRALSTAPEIDVVRLQHYEDGEVSLRVYLRLPASRQRLLALLGQAMPGAEALPAEALPAAPSGELLVRLPESNRSGLYPEV